jgi:bifunctional DNA-binding transcriptional regulator/antitoxin component of YhaV-PrlF toxin-antitoxin module
LRLESALPSKVKAVKIGNSIRITISKPVVDYPKIKEGDSLEITVQHKIAK